MKFFLKLFVTLVIVLSIGALSMGCKKSEGPSQTQTDPTGARERVNQANQIFIPRLALIILSGGRDTTAFNLSTANGLYREALGLDPDNLDAHFGVAMTGVLILGADPELRALFSGGTARFLSSGIHLGAQFTVSEEITSRLLRKLTTFSSTPLPFSPMGIYDGLLHYSDQRPFSYYQNLIETKVLPVLADAISHFARITQNPNYAFYITSQMAGTQLDDSIRIDLTEIYALLISTQGLHALGSLTVAYNVDFDARDSAAVFQALQVNSPFLALRTNGQQRMRDSKTSILGLVSSGKSGITFLLNETSHPGIDPIPKPTRPEDIAQLNQIVAQLDTVRLFLTTSQQVQTERGPLTINLASFFDNAITNFKQELPTYTVEVERNPYGFDPVLVWQATSYSNWSFPDPTFNGLFPGLSDAGFKQVFGLTQSSWSQRWVIRIGRGPGGGGGPSCPPSPIGIYVGPGTTPQYTWFPGPIATLFVYRSTGEPAWRIQCDPYQDCINAPVVHGTVPGGTFESFGQERTLVQGVRYIVSVSRTNGEFGCIEFVP